MSVYADYLMVCLCVLVSGFVLFVVYLLALTAASSTANVFKAHKKPVEPPEDPTTAPYGWQMEPLPPPASSQNGIPQQRGFPPVSQ